MGKFEDFNLDLTVHKDENNTGIKPPKLSKENVCTHKEVCTGTACSVTIEVSKAMCSKGCISSHDCSTKVCPGSTSRRK